MLNLLQTPATFTQGFCRLAGGLGVVRFAGCSNIQMHKPEVTVSLGVE